MQHKAKYFGTDGIRGVVGEFPITPDFVLKLGFALGKILAQESRGHVIIGKDTRISGYMFESALEAGLVAAGMDISLLGPMPTPAIAYLTKTLRARAGIVISASHNQYTDNGIKFFDANGYKFSAELEAKIEEQVDLPLETVESSKFGKARRITDAPGRYIEFCKTALLDNLQLNNLKIVIDCANGATYHIAPSVFAELGAEVIVIGNKPNGLNINDNCGSTAPELLSKTVIEEKADLGVAFDGDGDRLIMVDNTGAIVDGDVILYIIARLYQRLQILTGGVVGTVMSNLGLEHSLKQHGINFKRTNVGDKYILRELQTLNWNLGGEASGHIICKDKISSGDGIIASLKVISALLVFNKSLAEFQQEMLKFSQVIINFKTIYKTQIIESEVVKKALKTAQDLLGRHGRIVLRGSGTEPLIRLMVEGENQALIQKVADELMLAIDDCARWLLP